MIRYVRPIILQCAAWAVLAVCAEPLSPKQVLAYNQAEASGNSRVSVKGVVVFVSGIATNRFIIAPMEDVKQRGLEVLTVDGVAIPAPGDLVEIEGMTTWQNHCVSVLADRVDVIHNEDLPPAKGAKQSDFRRGILSGRRVTLVGTVREVRVETRGDLAVTRLLLYIDRYTAPVCLPGTFESDVLLGEPVRIEGIVSSVYGRDGKFLDSELEAAGWESITFLRKGQVPRALFYISIIFGVLLVLAVGVFLTLWLHGRRERRLMAVIDAERRRMAADLHDTIEQNLAGASLLAASVIALEETTPKIAEVMRSMAALLANAKAEVRSVVLNLRSAGQEMKPLAEALADIARGLQKTGLKVRKNLRGLPEHLPEAAYQDLVLIVREAATNAVKHGKAEHIIFASDPVEGGFVLRVLNDGAPFEVEQALGPETGHYGLSGMKERAMRNRFQIGWGRHESWMSVEIRVRGTYD